MQPASFLKHFLVWLLALIVVLFYVAILFFYPMNVAPVYYDFVLHVLAGTWLSAAAIFVLFYSKAVSYRGGFWISLALVLGIIMLIGVLWELYEYIMYTFAYAPGEPISDTMSDFVAELIGGGTFFLVFWRYLRPQS